MSEKAKLYMVCAANLVFMALITYKFKFFSALFYFFTKQSFVFVYKTGLFQKGKFF